MQYILVNFLLFKCCLILELQKFQKILYYFDLSIVAMSSEKGNVKKGAPAHQNTFAFKHNKNSRKTAKILSLPNQGLCSKCHDIIEWKKKYRKYKPLTSARKW